MAQMIFVNLPVADVERSAAFYEAVGAVRDPRFSSPGTAASMAFSDTIVVMLLSHEHFMNFSPKPIGDPHTNVLNLISLSSESREAVDAIVEAAVAAGGKGDPSPIDEMGDYMYGRGFEDFDGHGFGVMWMDVDAMMAAMAAAPGDAAASATAA